MTRNYYMVRAQGSSKEELAVFIDNSVVAVGWSDVSFADINDTEKLRDKVENEYYKNHNISCQQRGKKLNEVVRFKGINEGDYILVPYYSYIALAVAKSEEIYSEEVYEMDMANQRLVSYRKGNTGLYLIPRNDLSEALQRRLRVRGMTVSDLNEFSEEIDKLFSEKQLTYAQDIIEKDREKLNSFKKILLSNIRSGKTNLQTGGIGMEELVCELLVCEGYKAKVLAKTKFSGDADADIEAIKEDYFSRTYLFVQVKHHSGTTGISGVQQVIDVLSQDDYKQYEGYLVTSAEISDDAKNLADRNGIGCMNGDMLVDLIVDHLGELKQSTKYKLGISMYPMMLVQEDK